MILDIDPLVDCVFKALLGSEENKDLLIHFLNAMLALPDGERIQDVQLLNPHLERAHLRDKLSIVDVMAVANTGEIIQVDVQIWLPEYLERRMTYNWATILGSQLKQGEDYDKVKDVVSIWLLNQPFFGATPEGFHHLRLSDDRTGAIIMPRSGIFIVELPKVDRLAPVRTEADRWQRFFVEGKELDPDNPPDYMKTPEMEKAMETMRGFHQKGGEQALRYLKEHLRNLEENTVRRRLKKADELEEKMESILAEAENAQLKAKEADARAKEADAKALEADARAKEADVEAEALRAELEVLRKKLAHMGQEPQSP